MELVLLFVRVALSVVFVLAGTAKLASSQSPDKVVETFELGPWARPAVRALPFGELGVGAGLAFPATARPSAVAAAAMLAVFSALLVRQAARGLSMSCNCFGSLGASVTGRLPLARNLGLLFASLAVASLPKGPKLSALANTLAQSAELVVLVSCGAVVGALAWNRSHGGNRTTAGAPPVPELVSGGQPTIALFLEPHCGPCRALLPAVRRFGESGRGEALVVVTRQGPDIDGEFAAATAGAWRQVRDSGQLAARLGVPATPAAVVLGPDGSVRELVVGAPGVGQVLGDSGTGPFTPAPEVEVPAILSRRRLVAAGFGGVVLLPGLGRSLLGRSLLGRSASLGTQRHAFSSASGVTCPSCGSCVVCSASSSSPKKLSCGPCSQRCSGHKLCASYANEYGPFTALAGYLRSKGYVQDSDVLTYGLERDGQLTVLSGVTKFKGGPPASPTAVLIYELTNGGQNAWAALKTEKGLFGSVATVVGGQVVSAALSPPPPSATVGSPARAVGTTREVEAAGTSPYSCADVCAFALGVAISMLTLPAAVVSAPETAALAFAGSLFAGGAGLVSGPTGDALSTLLPLVQGATLVDGVLGGLAGLFDAKGATAFCADFACKLLKFCCTSNGACYGSDGECEHDCPAGLAHPMSHCNAYLDGKIVSTLVAL